jgi:hypothetical protein
MTDTQDQPLWRVMHKAHSAVSDPFGKAIRASYAAEIRAVADWLVSKQPEPEMQTLPPTVDYGTAWALWHQRDDLRQRLLAEADRAARGEA